MPERWTPHVTVAAVIERRVAGVPEFLLVEERTSEGLQLNNPAGHLEPAESPEQGVVREVLEETARVFTPARFLGVYLSRAVRAATGDDVTYVRLAFCGTVSEQDEARRLDDGIVRTVWMTLYEVRASRARHRSPHVLGSIEDAVSGRAFPLTAITTDRSVFAPQLLRRPDAGGPAAGADVTLQEITAATVRAVCDLRVAPEQARYVAGNGASIAQAHFEPRAWFRAIHAGDDLVGFVMLREGGTPTLESPGNEGVSLWRLMIDHRHQKRGYGRKALALVIDHVRSKPGVRFLHTSYVAGPHGPRDFYLGMGFRHTGETTANDEVALVLEL